MMDITQVALVIGGAIIAYLLGSVPTSVWVSKVFFGFDIREKGSGNAGATNVIRTIGLRVGLFVLAVDILKGYVAVLLWRLPFIEYAGSAYELNFKLLLGCCAVAGHIFPAFAGFKGGKGIATLLGVLIAIYPFIIVYLLLVFFIVLLITRYVSLASMLSAISFPLILVIFFMDKVEQPTILFVAFPIITGILVPITHKKNIIRLWKGEESKFKLKKRSN